VTRAELLATARALAWPPAVIASLGVGIDGERAWRGFVKHAAEAQLAELEEALTRAPIDVARDVLLAAAADVGWPLVDVDHAAIQGESTWRAAPFTPRQRVTALARLAPALLKLGEGQERLAEWQVLNGERQAPETRTVIRRTLRDRLAFFGDSSVLDVVSEALAIAPAPVRDFVRTEVAFVAVGWDTRAWTSGAVLRGPDGRRRARMVVLSGADRHPASLTHVTLHEVAHQWSDPVAHWTKLTTGLENVSALAREEGWYEHARERNADVERQADTLALAWQCAALVAP
jgi:hypothetical protein